MTTDASILDVFSPQGKYQFLSSTQSLEIKVMFKVHSTTKFKWIFKGSISNPFFSPFIKSTHCLSLSYAGILINYFFWKRVCGENLSQRIDRERTSVSIKNYLLLIHALINFLQGLTYLMSILIIVSIRENKANFKENNFN